MKTRVLKHYSYNELFYYEVEKLTSYGKWVSVGVFQDSFIAKTVAADLAEMEENNIIAQYGK